MRLGPRMSLALCLGLRASPAGLSSGSFRFVMRPCIPPSLQVMSLASVYGLEPRGCGRTGTTLFKTHMARLPGEEGMKLVRRE